MRGGEGEPLVRLEGVSVCYEGTTVLDGVNLSIFQDDYIGIIGPNGGGKTTLLKLILGLLEPWTGRVWKSPRCLQGGVGYLPQSHQMDASFPITALEVVCSGALGRRSWWRSRSRAVRLKAGEWMERLGVGALAAKRLGDLSGGQRQRVLLGRALVDEPALLVLDEPDTYVDQAFSEALPEVLGELNRQGMAVLLVSHDVGMVAGQVRSVACVNRAVTHHPEADLTEEELGMYGCPIDLIAHGAIPHRVLRRHGGAESLPSGMPRGKGAGHA